MRGGILHPELLTGLAETGHGARILIADALYPHSTGVNPAARRVHLNVMPGLVAAHDVLELVAENVHLEAALYMKTSEGDMSEPVRTFQSAVADHRHSGETPISWQGLERNEFYAASREPVTSLLIATGEVRPYANLLLTVGVP